MINFLQKYINNKELVIIGGIILLVIFRAVKCDNCVSESYSHLKHVKAITLKNNNKIILSASGIYTFYPDLTNMIYSYLFYDIQKLPEGEEANYISNGDISQFSGEDGETKYVLLIVKQIVYVLNENGSVLFYGDISAKLGSNSPISLVAYKYENNIYYFTLTYTITNIYQMRLIYYKITFTGENIGDITFIRELNERIAYEGISHWINSINISCNRMYLSSDIVLSCIFCSIEAKNSIMALNYNPDNEFSKISLSNIVEDPDDESIKYIKTSTNNDRTKALICYSIETQKGRCLHYDINENILSSIFVESEYCNSEPYGINAYYFEEPNEYVFSCVNGKNKFFMKRINSDFNMIDYDLFDGKEYSDCSDYTTFSIVYLSDYDVYANIMNANCDNNEYIRFSMLLDDSCKMPEKKNKAGTTTPEIITTSVTTIPTTDVTTIPKIITTIVTTMPEIVTTIVTSVLEIVTTIVTTEPEIVTTIVTTVPEIITTIVTTAPLIETTIIKTAIPPNIPETTILHISTTFPQMFSSLPDVQSTITSIKTDKIETTVIQTQVSCKEKGKIYHEGECICDEKNEYYSISSKYSKNRCYKKSELPKNVYYNNITKTYEICFQTCATCSKGGTLTENNCLECSKNYIKEPENHSSNCVDNCKYYYYYDSLNTYICTEDEQCPKDFGLIIRQKNKCIKNCKNEIHTHFNIMENAFHLVQLVLNLINLIFAK